MGIYGASGLNVPTFQAAGGKSDGQGNGSGTYEGGGGFGEPEQQQAPQQFYPQFDDLGDTPFIAPRFGSTPDSLTAWKTALALKLYENAHYEVEATDN